MEVAQGLIGAQRPAEVVGGHPDADLEPSLPHQPRQRLESAFGDDVGTLDRVGEQPPSHHVGQRLAVLEGLHIEIVEFRAGD